jgi:hypothetical protein
MKRRRINAEEQLAQVLNHQDHFTFRTSRTVMARRHGVRLVRGWENIAGLFDVDEQTLRKARQGDPVLKRLILKPKGRVFLDLAAMSDLDWTYLSTAITLRSAASPAKRLAASKREAAKRKARAV